MPRRPGGFTRLRGGRRKIQGPQNKRYNRPKGKHDWTMQGYNYLGPGNAMDGAPAQSFADEYAVQHDEEYGRFTSQYGINPKYVYVDGVDDEFEKRMENTRDDFASEIAYQAFRAKRKAAEWGVLPRKRLHKMSLKREFYHIDSFPNMDQGTQVHYTI